MDPVRIQLGDAPQQAAFGTALLHFLSSVREIPLVGRVVYNAPAGVLHLWVLLAKESREVEEQVILLDREFRLAAGGPPVDVHVLSLDSVKASDISPVEVLFER